MDNNRMSTELTLDISGSTMEILNNLKKNFNVKTIEDVIRRCIAIGEYVSLKQTDGRLTVLKDGNQYTLLIDR